MAPKEVWPLLPRPLTCPAVEGMARSVCGQVCGRGGVRAGQPGGQMFRGAWRSASGGPPHRRAGPRGGSPSCVPVLAVVRHGGGAVLAKDAGPVCGVSLTAASRVQPRLDWGLEGPPPLGQWWDPCGGQRAGQAWLLAPACRASESRVCQEGALFRKPCGCKAGSRSTSFSERQQSARWASAPLSPPSGRGRAWPALGRSPEDQIRQQKPVPKVCLRDSIRVAACGQPSSCRPRGGPRDHQGPCGALRVSVLSVSASAL